MATVTAKPKTAPLLRADMTSAELSELRTRIVESVPQIDRQLSELGHELMTSSDPNDVLDRAMRMIAKALLTPGAVAAVVGAMESQRANEKLDQLDRDRKTLADLEEQLRAAQTKLDGLSDELEIVGQQAVVRALQGKRDHLASVIERAKKDTRTIGPRARAQEQLTAAEARLRRVRSLADIKDPSQRPEHYNPAEESALEGRITALRMELENLPEDTKRLDPLDTTAWPETATNAAHGAREVWRGRIAKALLPR